MDKMKGFSVLLVTAVTTVSLVSCGQATSSKVSSDSEVSSVVNAKVSAWDNLNDKEKDFYKGLEKKGHTIIGRVLFYCLFFQFRTLAIV